MKNGYYYSYYQNMALFSNLRMFKGMEKWFWLKNINISYYFTIVKHYFTIIKEIRVCVFMFFLNINFNSHFAYII